MIPNPCGSNPRINPWGTPWFDILTSKKLYQHKQNFLLFRSNSNYPKAIVWTVYSYHVTYAFKSESTLNRCLIDMQLLAQKKKKFKWTWNPVALGRCVGVLKNFEHFPGKHLCQSLCLMMMMMMMMMIIIIIIIKTCEVKASSWPLATSCSSPKRNILTLKTASAKTIKRHNNNNNNSNNNNNNNNNRRLPR